MDFFDGLFLLLGSVWTERKIKESKCQEEKRKKRKKINLSFSLNYFAGKKGKLVQYHSHFLFFSPFFHVWKIWVFRKNYLLKYNNQLLHLPKLKESDKNGGCQMEESDKRRGCPLRPYPYPYRILSTDCSHGLQTLSNTSK